MPWSTRPSTRIWRSSSSRSGSILIRSSQTVDDVERQLVEIAEAFGVDDLEVIALPTAMMLESRKTAEVSSRLRSIRGGGLRLDQVGSVDALARRARLGDITPREGLDELEAIRSRRPPHSRIVRALGFGVLATGFSLALQPSLDGVMMSLILGTVVGAFLVLDLPGFSTLAPTLLTFGVSVTIFALSDIYGGENPIRLLIPPLLWFLPGVKITLGTIELAEGAAVSGASRLTSGLMDLLLLSTAIVAAAALIDIPQRDLLDRPAPQAEEWVLLPALLLIALGYRYFSCVERRALPWILLVMTAALAGEVAASTVFTPAVSAFVGAAAMTPIVLAVDRRPQGPRAMVLFLPGIYILVPGATGLINFTEQVGPGFSTGSLVNTMVIVVAIALGVLFSKAGEEAVVGLTAMIRRGRATSI